MLSVILRDEGDTVGVRDEVEDVPLTDEQAASDIMAGAALLQIGSLPRDLPALAVMGWSSEICYGTKPNLLRRMLAAHSNGQISRATWLTSHVPWSTAQKT